MISHMSFIQVIGPRESFGCVVDVIQEVGMLQIEEVPLAEGGSGDELLHRAQLSSRQAADKDIYQELVELLDNDAAPHTAGGYTPPSRNSEAFIKLYRDWDQQNSEAIGAVTRSLHAEARSFRRRERNLDDDLRILMAYEEVVTAMSPMLKAQEMPADYEFVGVIFERRSRQARALLQEQLDKMTAGQYRFFQSSLVKGRVAALIGFSRHSANKVRTFISDAGISEIRGPRYLRDKPFTEALVSLEEDLATLKQQKEVLERRKAEFFREKGMLLNVLECVCRDKLSRLSAISSCAQTHYTFIIEGWAPTSRLDELKTCLSNAGCSSAVVRRIQAHGAASSPPVLLTNPRPIRPFQPLLGLLPLPRYGTIDPTLFMATFFPPIFGMMLADVGYGLLLAVGAAMLWYFTRGKMARALAMVLGCCAFFTIVFGFVFGEMFGSQGHLIALEPLWRERFELTGPHKGSALLAYLILAVGVGMAQILCGLVLGIVNARRSGHNNRIVNYAARIIGLFGLFFIVGRLAQFLPPVFTSLGVVSLVVFFVLMVWASVQHPIHGLMLPLELLGTVGNILSYARIMAVGLASAVLAMLANRFGSMISNVILATIVVVLVHALNLALGVVDPTIQGLRLHYVEFFSKFYEGGGRVYSPFRKMGGQLQ